MDRAAGRRPPRRWSRCRVVTVSSKGKRTVPRHAEIGNTLSTRIGKDLNVRPVTGYFANPNSSRRRLRLFRRRCGYSMRLDRSARPAESSDLAAIRGAIDQSFKLSARGAPISTVVHSRGRRRAPRCSIAAGARHIGRADGRFAPLLQRVNKGPPRQRLPVLHEEAALQ